MAKTPLQNKGNRDSIEKEMHGRRVTSYDVAKHANVSQSAVSRCFKNGGSVSKAMRNKVNKAIKELGYQPNAYARNLITQRSDLIAVLVSEFGIYPKMLTSLSRKLAKRGRNMLVFSYTDEQDASLIVDQIKQYRVGGVIVAVDFPEDQMKALIKSGVQVVCINRNYSDLPISSVCCDQVAGERVLVSLLFDAGHREFSIIAGPNESSVSLQRTSGAINRLHELGLDDYTIAYGDYSYDSGGEALKKIVTDRKLRMPSSVICANDLMAFGCMDKARNHYQLKVPDDLAVVGFDGAEQVHWDNYKLTTISQPIESMVEAALFIVLERIEKPNLPTERRMFTGSLHQGTST